MNAELLNRDRGEWWSEHYKPNVAQELGSAITALGLDESWENIAKDPLRLALANALWSSTIACFGPQLSADTLVALNKARFGPEYITADVSAHVFTGNHLSVSGKLFPLDSQGNHIPGPVLVHHMPTFVSIEGGKPTIGDISPITLEPVDDKFELSLKTPNGYVWRKTLDVIKAASYTTQLVGKDGLKAPVKSIASPCVSSFQVMILRPDCQENCLMCTVARGTGAIPEFYQVQVSEVLDVLLGDAAAKGHAFQQTFTGGSLSNGDGGFASAHGWGMELLAQKISVIEEETGNKIPVQIQLEMVLPKDQSTWQGIINTLSHYTNDLGWKISLAINMEVIQDDWKPEFLQGRIKSQTTLYDHLAFAQQVHDGTDGMVHINSLIMFGMKPIDLQDGQYLAADLSVLKQLIHAGINPDYQPVKIEGNTPLEAYPPPNPVYLLLQDIALKQMISQARLPWSPGCVGGCNACDQSHETIQLLKAAKKAGAFLPDVLAPLLIKLGDTYSELYREIFSSHVYGAPVTLYEAKS